MRRQTRAGRCSHWQMALGCKPSLNSNKLHSRGNSKTAFPTTKTNLDFAKESEILIKSKDIYSQQGFFGGNMITPEPEGITSGEVAEEPRGSEETTWVRTNHAHDARNPAG